MRMSRFPTWTGGVILVLVVTGMGAACQTLREVSNLKDVRFRIERASNPQLAGISLDRVQSYNDLGGVHLARLGASLADGTLPFSFTLRLEATNPESNRLNARLTQMDWTLLLQERETISGTFDREITLPPGEPTGVPVDVKLDLVEFFGDNLRQLVGLATAVGGEGPPTNVKLKVQPTIQTRLGPMRYPSPITVVSEDLGKSQ